MASFACKSPESFDSFNLLTHPELVTGSRLDGTPTATDLGGSAAGMGVAGSPVASAERPTGVKISEPREDDAVAKVSSSCFRIM